MFNSLKVNDMTTVKIDNTHWISGMKAAGEVYNLVGPMKNDKVGYEFRNLKREEIPNLGFINTVLSPKRFLFPQSEKILEYSSSTSCDMDHSNIKETNEEYSPRAIVGIRPCDTKANTILNMNFDTPDIKDPHWVKAYKATTFITLACDNPCSSCFCTTAGVGPYDVEGSDLILFTKDDDGYYAKIITEKGDKFVDDAGWRDLPTEQSLIFDQRKDHAETKISSKIQTDKLKGIELLGLYNAHFWDDVSFACINCGTCTFVCPTCWCFDIQDDVSKKSCVRMKNWDSCMFPIFTLHTTGHNPRGTKKYRVRQRFMHKLKYYVDKYDRGIMCVGCGRCVRSCPVNIDIRKVCELMNSFKSESACAV